MKWTVLWTKSAEQHLAAVYLASTSPNAVTSASHAIDTILGRSPDTKGTPNFDTVRTLIVEPLGVDYEVIADDRLVYVLSVWRTST
jgi:hypothetical protein